MTTPTPQSIDSRQARTVPRPRRPRRRHRIGLCGAVILAALVALHAPAWAHAHARTPTGREVASQAAREAQQPFVRMPLADLLAKKITVATITSLTAHATQPEVQARLAEALRDPRAPVRTVAARVVFVTASRGLLPAVRAALAGEPDPAAANEMIRVLVTFGGSDALDDAWRAVDRLNAYALPALAESLARLDRPELLAQLPRIVASRMTSRGLAERVLDLTAADPARRQAAIDAFLEVPLSAQELQRAMAVRNEPIPAALGARFEQILRMPKAGPPEASGASPDQPSIRMTSPLAPGLWRELSSLYRCHLSRPMALAARVRYAPDGRPRQIALVRDEVPGCDAVVAVLASLSLAADARPVPADVAEVQVVPWQKDAVACADRPADWRRSARTFVHMKNPDTKWLTKLKEAAPMYPPSLRGESGTVRLDALVGTDGCIREIQVRRPSEHTLFAFAALLAVAQWRFEPATVGGQPAHVWTVMEMDFTS